MKKYLSFIFVLCLLLLFIGCTEKEVNPTKVTVEANATSVEVGSTISLKVSVS